MVLRMPKRQQPSHQLSTYCGQEAPSTLSALSLSLSSPGSSLQPLNLCRLPVTLSKAMATTSSSLTSPFAQNYHLNAQRASLPCRRPPPPRRPSYRPTWAFSINCHCGPTWTTKHVREVSCKATEVSVAEESPSSGEGGSGGDSGGAENWVPVVPLAALPKGERRVITQDDETILLLWYKDEVFAIENRSPAEGAYSEGLLNAKLTQDGCIVCPTTDSTFDLRSGAIKEWYPKNPVLRVLTPALRTLFVYPLKTDEENIYIGLRGGIKPDASAEIVFSGKAQPGVTATDVNVDEVKMVVDEDLEGFGFTGKNELINGKAAVIGFLLLLDFELLTGKGLLKGTGFLDFIYAVSDAFK